MFIIEGLASVALCFVVWTRLDSTPKDAKWLSDAERDSLAAHLRRDEMVKVGNAAVADHVPQRRAHAGGRRQTGAEHAAHGLDPRFDADALQQVAQQQMLGGAGAPPLAQEIRRRAPAGGGIGHAAHCMENFLHARENIAAAADALGRDGDRKRDPPGNSADFGQILSVGAPIHLEHPLKALAVHRGGMCW